MNINTGELRMFSPEELAALKQNHSEEFFPVPDELQAEAMELIAQAGPDSESVKVDLDGDTALAKWAEDKRAERDRKRTTANKKKRKRKMVRRSRARNYR